jgi:hypothetical protein
VVKRLDGRQISTENLDHIVKARRGAQLGMNCRN